MAVRVAVDKDLCISSAECVRVAPEAFALDDDGLSEPTAVAAAAPLEQLLDAAAQCPVLAVRVGGAQS